MTIVHEDIIDLAGHEKPMPGTTEWFIVQRAKLVAIQARKNPDCAKAARNWLCLAASAAERKGQYNIASVARHCNAFILEVNNVPV